MRRALRWLRNGVLGLVTVVLLFLIAAYTRSEWIVRKKHEIPGSPVTVPADSSSVAEGARIAKTRGCIGCHGDNLQGKMFIDNALLARIAAPNLTAAAKEYSDADLERIIRHGVRPDNRSVIAMPSEMFNTLSDDDTGRLLAYIRSIPVTPGQPRKMQPGVLGRIGMAVGQFNPTVANVQRALAANDSFPATESPHARGAYLARTSCTECHGITLKGQGSPDLVVAAGYSREQFATLLKTGVALGGRELPLMSRVARSRFVHFTDDEIAALHDYLKARAAGD